MHKTKVNTTVTMRSVTIVKLTSGLVGSTGEWTVVVGTGLGTVSSGINERAQESAFGTWERVGSFAGVGSRPGTSRRGQPTVETSWTSAGLPGGDGEWCR